MAYLKRGRRGRTSALELRQPELVPGPAGAACAGTPCELARRARRRPRLPRPAVQPALLLLELPHLGDARPLGRPEVYGIARKRVDCRTTKSAYNSRRHASAALAQLLETVAAPWLLVSLSNETHHDTDHVCELLAEHGHVGVVELQSKRYVGAQIGIHNPAGVRVGEVSHLTNSELLLLVGPDPVVIDRALGRAAEPAAA